MDNARRARRNGRSSIAESSVACGSRCRTVADSEAIRDSIRQRDHMSSGLLALLDDVVAIAKVAAASIDDVAAQAAKTSTKAAGIVIDDAAVTPGYAIGFTPDRELPIIGKIAWGSLRNKVLFLLPAALALSAFLPWAITPLLMAGGLFLCFEGYEKVHDWFAGTEKAPAEKVAALAQTARDLEDAKVNSAIRTDLILSAEIMAISLSTVAHMSFWMQAAVLIVVALVVTALVYGVVAMIVKADDVGLRMARSKLPHRRAIGRLLVQGMPGFLQCLSVVGTLAMLWVGGGIIVHGLASFGLTSVEHALHEAGVAIGSFGPLLSGLLSWLVQAAGAGVIGLALGAIVAPVAERFLHH